jgi:hypothetical protein
MECVKVDTHISGEINCSDFERKLMQNKDKPAIINVNIGELVCSLIFQTISSCVLFIKKFYHTS